MTISERILLSISRAPGDSDYELQKEAITIDCALAILHRVYPNLSALVSGKRVMDFGCGAGYQCIALVKTYNCSVIGIDTNKKMLKEAVVNAKNHNISSQQLSFVESVSPSMFNSFDVVLSHNSFEHFANPEQILSDMSKVVNDSGVILITFGPPWFAPYGSHMRFFCKMPWINIIFSEKTVMKVRSYFRDDGAKRYEEVEAGLNKMTIARFESIIASSGLMIKYRKYEGIKGMDWLSKFSILRELFINHASVILSKSNK